MSCKISSAYFIGFNEIAVRAESVGKSSSYSVMGEDDNNLVLIDGKGKACESVKAVSGQNDLTIVKLQDDIDVSRKYRIVENESGSVSYIRLYKLFGTSEFDNKYFYGGKLGVELGISTTAFRVWSPVARSVTLNVYDSGSSLSRREFSMERRERGVWELAIDEDLSGKYYTYTVNVYGVCRETVDPYAHSVCANGKRGMIIDAGGIDVDGWSKQGKPVVGGTHGVIYEAQLRDLTIHESSNVSKANRGKYLGLTERGSGGSRTPLDRIVELGVSAVHFQPLYDFGSVDETFAVATYDKDGEYNWGYDPVNYNAPEGSFSSNPDDGECRVRELKQMIKALHDNGLAVIMDVVYNHMFDASSSNFEAIVPDYYFRMSDSGEFLDGSGCGNETASDHSMCRKFIVESILHWAKDYHFDGFRFDLMGLHDVTTMNAVYDALVKINPDIIVYGEGWTAGSCGLAGGESAVKANAVKTPNVAYFSDLVRDGLKGSVFEATDCGFVNGKNCNAGVYVGAVGGTDILSRDAYSTIGCEPFASSPLQSINYVSAHDNATLWDKLNASVNDSDDVLRAMNRLAAVAVMTSQGVSFILAGEELLRSKPTTKEGKNDSRPIPYLTNPDYYFSENSYRSTDSVNAIDWTLADKNVDMVNFYKELIKIKRTFSEFGISDKQTLKDCLRIDDNDLFDGFAAYSVKAPNDSEFAVVALNATRESKKLCVPNGEYKILVNGDRATSDRNEPVATFIGDTLTVLPLSAVVMVGDANGKKSLVVTKRSADNVGLGESVCDIAKIERIVLD